MHIVDKHIIYHIGGFIQAEDKTFEMIFDQLSCTQKQTNKQLLKYIYNVLTSYEAQSEADLNSLHLHFNNSSDASVKQLIAEFIIIYQFKRFSSVNEQRINNAQFAVERRRTMLKAAQMKLTSCPDGASGKNGGNKIFKKWQNDKKRTSALLSFYEKLNDCASLTPKAIFNCQIKLQRIISDLFVSRPFAIEIDNADELYTCVIINTDNLNSIKTTQVDGQFLLKLIETVIIYDSENSVKRFGEFNLERLSNLNRNHGTNFQNLILISFGSEVTGINDIKEKIDLIKGRFKLPDCSSYTLLASEVSYLAGKKPQNQAAVSFWGLDNVVFWKDFVLEISIRDLYELRSIKMLNIYSLAFNDDIKEYILESIFSESAKSYLLSEETKQIISELSKDDKKVIRDALEKSLHLLIEEGWRDRIVKLIQNETEIVLPENVLNNPELKAKIISALHLTKDNKLISWSNLNSKTSKPILILAYRDPGKYPYYFTPNLLETKFENSNQVNALFLKCLFYIQFEWAKYNLSKDTLKYLNHTLRERHFKWSELRKEIRSNRPEKRDSTLWDLENEYSLSDVRDTIKIKFRTSKKTKNYLASDLFIVKFASTSKLRVERLSQLASTDLTEDGIAVQSLDEIQESINIYERIIDVNQQEQELMVIRDEFDLGEVDPGKLWKILLKKNVGLRTEDVVYSELKDFLKAKNLNIVSFFHFRNNWINPSSESFTPLSKKVFIALCEYLHIPRAYYAIMQRIKNVSKQASRQSTRQMNYLLKDLFNDGCFDDITKANSLIESKINVYKRNHSADELGTSDDHLLKTLVTLVELIHPELKLQEVESIQKIEE